MNTIKVLSWVNKLRADIFEPIEQDIINPDLHANGWYFVYLAPTSNDCYAGLGGIYILSFLL